MKYTVLRSPEFARWLAALRDSKARTRIQARIDRLEIGLLGDVKFVGARVWEMRVDYGPGYRVYFCRRGQNVIILLAGGDKRTQGKDIERAAGLAMAYGS